MNFVKAGKYIFCFKIMIIMSFKETHSGLLRFSICCTYFLGGVGDAWVLSYAVLSWH